MVGEAGGPGLVRAGNYRIVAKPQPSILTRSLTPLPRHLSHQLSCPSDMSWVSLRCGTTIKRKWRADVGAPQIKCRCPTSLGVCTSPSSDQSCSAASGCLGFASQRLTWLQFGTCHLPTCKSWSRLHPVGLDARRALVGKGGLQRRRDAAGRHFCAFVSESNPDENGNGCCCCEVAPQARRFRGCDVWNGRPSAVYRLGVVKECLLPTPTGSPPVSAAHQPKTRPSSCCVLLEPVFRNLLCASCRPGSLEQRGTQATNVGC
ncbi:uncharacterized protein B0H64DRAFT_84796 [Chaetomium fimeti]|uniref:Uncharacterized protein n=1 Tax=Chaetomium fimeti TaxID=1854472 RepID=A0AAE0LW50_9PEZI|nr:hypothetical protein B0H64DRAFT_84796 [Chaetomium fimeti]